MSADQWKEKSLNRKGKFRNIAITQWNQPILSAKFVTSKLSKYIFNDYSMSSSEMEKINNKSG